MMLRSLAALAVAGIVGAATRAQDPDVPSLPPEPGARGSMVQEDLEWTKVRRPEFLSVVEDGEGRPTALRTSVVRFKPFDGESPVEHVDLVGAVHVGDQAYYARLNALFTGYDVVLFELAHKEDPRDELSKRRREPDLMKVFGLDPGGMLGLESQVERIDYSKENFVHADTSLLDAMERRGDDWISVMAGLLADLRRQSNLQNRPGGGRPNPDEPTEAVDPFGGLFGFGMSADPLELKRRFARQLESQGLDGLPGFTTLNDLLVTERNKVAMKRFEEQVVLGKRRIAIFYGAAHMRDFTQRLVVDHGFRPVEMAWLRAWDLRERGDPRSRRPRSSLDLFGDEMDRDGAHQLVDQLFDALEQMLREADSEPAPPRRNGR